MEKKIFRTVWYQREYTLTTAITTLLLLAVMAYQLGLDWILIYPTYIPFIVGLLLMLWYLLRTFRYKVVITNNGKIIEKRFLRKDRIISATDIAELSSHVVWRPGIGFTEIEVLKAVKQDYYSPAIINRKYKKFPIMPVPSEIYNTISRLSNNLTINNEAIQRVQQTEDGFKKLKWLNIIVYIVMVIVFSFLFAWFYYIKSVNL